MSYEKILPRELWQKILVDVSPWDLCNVVRTSSHMNDMASWPDLWAGMTVNTGKLLEDGLVQLYSINRFKKVLALDISKIELNYEEIVKILHDVPRSNWKNMDLSDKKLDKVPAELLARAVSGLHTVNLSATRLMPAQCVKVVEAIHNSKTLVDVNLGYFNLSRVSAELLASAVSGLQTVNLSYTSLMPAQCLKVMEAIHNSKTLAGVNLGRVNLSGVPAELLARAVSGLQTVNLFFTSLTPVQCVKVVEAIHNSKTLVDVNLKWANLSGVSAELLASAVSGIKTVNLTYTRLKPEQCVKVVEAIQNSKTLVDVNLENVNLSEVPAELLARAVSGLQTVGLCKTTLTPAQCVNVVKAFHISKTLIDVNLGGVNLSGVPAELLASAVAGLQKVNLFATKLTPKQSVKLVESIHNSKTLVDVNLGLVNLSGVPAELLASTVQRIKVFLY